MIEVRCALPETPDDLYALIEDHLKRLFPSCLPTKYEHSYDEVKGVFRFDMQPEGEIEL